MGRYSSSKASPGRVGLDLLIGEQLRTDRGRERHTARESPHAHLSRTINPYPVESERQSCTSRTKSA
jgi:hypothetical protein